MRRIAGAPVSSEAQEHVSQAEPPVEAGQFRRCSRQGGRRLAVQHKRGVLQSVLESMVSGKAREGECLTGTGHGHVVQQSLGVRVLPGFNTIPSPSNTTTWSNSRPLTRYVSQHASIQVVLGLGFPEILHQLVGANDIVQDERPSVRHTWLLILQPTEVSLPRRLLLEVLDRIVRLSPTPS